MKDVAHTPDSYWRSLEESAGQPTPETGIGIGVSRRDFLRVMGASMALAGTAGCRRPIEKIVPYISQPEEVVLGVPSYYATTMPFGLDAYGVVVESHEGRPTKIEGNPLHPSTLGGSSALMQASILGMYDPDRSKHVLRDADIKEWAQFVEFWRGLEATYLESKGRGLAVLSESFSSPTLSRLKREFQQRFPEAIWVTYEPVSDENALKGIELAAGKPYRAIYDYSKAMVVLVLDADFLLMESNSISHARAFIQGRRMASESDSMNRLYVVESACTVTGAMADHRFPMPSSHIGAFLASVVLELETRGVTLGLDDALQGSEVAQVDRDLLRLVADDLLGHRGECLIVAGRRQPPIVHAMVAVLNQVLGNIGHTVSCVEVTDAVLPDRCALAELMAKMAQGDISTLLIMGGNPVYAAPVDLEFAESLKKVDHTVHLSHYEDETSQEVEWHIPRSHFLETWGDCSAGDGTLSVVQPLIEPLYGSKSEFELLNLVATGADRRGYEIVRQTWRNILPGGDFEDQWRRVLHDGVLQKSAMTPTQVEIWTRAVSDHLVEHPISKTAINRSHLEMVFQADHKVFDGRYANNAWLQELPDPITKLVWDNAALISPRLSEELDLRNGDTVRLRSGGRDLEMPVWIVPGQADYSVTVPLGYGRRRVGRVGDSTGFNAYRLRTSEAADFASAVTLTKLGKQYPLATTQHHHRMEGRPLALAASLEEYQGHPDFVKELVETPDLQSLWKEHRYEEGYQWGMAIDLNACIGCNACMIACQCENNVQVVGKRQAGYGRAMHWLRVDRYFEGDPRNPNILFQPVPCQQCEMAPCEQVCPVAATNHDKEGLNVMVYNRCVGTRYCSNNCPYKVRRFNFFNYVKSLPETVKMAQNPDVTVRSRGVMEKCSYCLQRINRAKLQAKREGRQIKDGEVMTACQQACPTGAIVFGNILDSQSQVRLKKESNRNYQILVEYNTRPRTSYLAKLRNPVA